MSETLLQAVGLILFLLALIHTFSTSVFVKLAAKSPEHEGLFHLLGETEVVFGFWALVFMVCMLPLAGGGAAMTYLEGLNFTEPMFVFVIMIMAATKPVITLATRTIFTVASRLPLPIGLSFFLSTLVLGPLLGSLITEPAAMTLSALILYVNLFSKPVSQRLKYATLGLLFVNVSIGGVLTNFAAPPVLMVASKWGLSNWDMLAGYGWKAAIAVVVNASAVAALFRKELAALSREIAFQHIDPIPAYVTATHVGFLAFTVVFAHHPVIFIAGFLFFLGFIHAYSRYQNELMLREGLLVAFFLAGLVALGGRQDWWLKLLLAKMDALVLYFGATGLTAITDNAALTYLGSLVGDLPPESRYALLSGAVTGGGLTVIANAPNPAGFAILREGFKDGAISHLWLLVAAIPPTLTAIACFLWLPR